MTVNAHVSTNLVNSMVPQEYEPFLSCRYVYSPESKVEKPIMILRDISANQSVLLQGILPLSEEN